MKKTMIVMGSLIALLVACHETDSLLTTDELSVQIFTINIAEDTTLLTAKGAVLKIPQGAIKASTATVQLQIKEAYSITEIVRAGLQTQSDGQPLSSGGMIYIHADNASITKPITVAIPSPFLDSNMKLFKGVDKDGTINWTEPRPLLPNKQLAALEKGRALFVNNCTACHSLDRNLTGPALAHVRKKFERSAATTGVIDLYEFTRNPAKVMARNEYFCFSKQLFGGVVMTSFPDLTDADLDNLYGWIDNESELRNLPDAGLNASDCIDSCRNYAAIAGHWESTKARLEKDSVSMVDVDLRFADTTAPPPVPPMALDDIDLVTPKANGSLYYQFQIDLFGWYNVDILMKGMPGTEESELMIRMQGQFKERFNIYLVVPAIRAFIAGGPLENAPDTYGFYTKDGKLPLPQGQHAYILAMGEYEDQLIFAKKAFVTQRSLQTGLELRITSKDEFNKQIASLDLPEASLKAADTYNADSLRKTVKELKKLAYLKPKNCDCNCLSNPAALDSLVTEKSY